MSKKQVVKLLQGLDYDKSPKAKFIKAVNGDLYDRHPSFLATPLLAILMLMTFEQFAEIPDKIHIFYDNAFETLFRRHDATKSQFFRKTRSGLPIDTFRHIFSAFCAISYMKSDFSFTRSAITEYLDKALRYCDVKAVSLDVLDDLTESLCVIQVEGFEYTFVHRSFQEYFCAVFLSKASTLDRMKLLPTIIQKMTDNVIPMLFDMARELFETDWVIPKVTEIASARKNSHFKPYLVHDGEIGTLTYVINNKETSFAIYMESVFSIEMITLRRIYEAHFIGSGVSAPLIGPGNYQSVLVQVVRDKMASGDTRFFPKVSGLNSNRRKGRGFGELSSVKLTVDDIPLLDMLGIGESLQKETRALGVILKEARARKDKRTTVVDDMFG